MPELSGTQNYTVEFNDFTMTGNSDSENDSSTIYGPHLAEMRLILRDVVEEITSVRAALKDEFGQDPVDHCLARIKSDESMREKLRRKGLAETADNALFEIKDAIGVRIVCSFLNDVYTIRDRIEALSDIVVTEEKGYIRHSKSNGYRSDHLIVRVRGKYFVEMQLRTISMDTWAALEHQMRYKKKRTDNDALIRAELKRCADELASTDVSMQTIRDMIMMDL